VDTVYIYSPIVLPVQTDTYISMICAVFHIRFIALTPLFFKRWALRTHTDCLTRLTSQLNYSKPRSGYLKTNNVGSVVLNLFEDMSPAMLPVERPRRAVAVELARGVLVTQNVVAHHREYCYNHNTLTQSLGVRSTNLFSTVITMLHRCPTRLPRHTFSDSLSILNSHFFPGEPGIAGFIMPPPTRRGIKQ